MYMGSHLDTVKEGGLYDGMLGVVGAVEAFRAFLADPAEKRVNVHILATNGEEGNDLGGTFGSRAMAGLVDPDVPGYMEKAAAYGLKREDFDSVQLPMKDGLCYLELHIEQGSTLDKAGEADWDRNGNRRASAVWNYGVRRKQPCGNDDDGIPKGRAGGSCEADRWF